MPDQKTLTPAQNAALAWWSGKKVEESIAAGSALPAPKKVKHHPAVVGDLANEVHLRPRLRVKGERVTAELTWDRQAGQVTGMPPTVLRLLKMSAADAKTVKTLTVVRAEDRRVDHDTVRLTLSHPKLPEEVSLPMRIVGDSYTDNSATAQLRRIITSAVSMAGKKVQLSVRPADFRRAAELVAREDVDDPADLGLNVMQLGVLGMILLRVGHKPEEFKVDERRRPHIQFSARTCWRQIMDHFHRGNSWAVGLVGRADGLAGPDARVDEPTPEEMAAAEAIFYEAANKGRYHPPTRPRPAPSRSEQGVLVLEAEAYDDLTSLPKPAAKLVINRRHDANAGIEEEEIDGHPVLHANNFVVGDARMNVEVVEKRKGISWGDAVDAITCSEIAIQDPPEELSAKTYTVKYGGIQTRVFVGEEGVIRDGREPVAERPELGPEELDGDGMPLTPDYDAPRVKLPAIRINLGLALTRDKPHEVTMALVRELEAGRKLTPQTLGYDLELDGDRLDVARVGDAIAETCKKLGPINSRFGERKRINAREAELMQLVEEITKATKKPKTEEQWHE